MENMIIKSKALEEHITNLEAILGESKKVRHATKPKKFHFWDSVLEILGIIPCKEGDIG